MSADNEMITTFSNASHGCEARFYVHISIKPTLIMSLSHAEFKDLHQCMAETLSMFDNSDSHEGTET